jgi:hypothetical protein
LPGAPTLANGAVPVGDLVSVALVSRENRHGALPRGLRRTLFVREYVVQEYGFSLNLFEAEVYGAADANRAVHDAGWNGCCLEGADANGGATLELDDNGSFLNDEELIRSRMHMPTVLPLEDGKAEAAVIHPVEHLIAVVLRHRRRFLAQIDDPQGWVLDGSLLYPAAVMPSVTTA